MSGRAAAFYAAFLDGFRMEFFADFFKDAAHLSGSLFTGFVSSHSLRQLCKPHVRHITAEEVVHEVAKGGAGFAVCAVDVDDVAAVVQFHGAARV